ncbi:hypothetical protein A6E14_11505 [Vibrio genomosp. F10]|uniref:Porin domain-containing protein n=2 Tax=Vibrio genomosp. F10 TaxID=723171 RepID=A0A1B9QY59_9VIBR|nr:hypothetical protein A6E14_11505 [Vibrio genomosp. F10]
MIAIAIIACSTMASQARDVQIYVGVNYERGHLNVGGHHANVGGLKFLSASELGWGNIKGTASTLTGDGADYDHYSLGVEKPIVESAQC